LVIFTKREKLRNYVIILLFICCSFTVKGQEDQLARNYLEQGEFAKAATTYELLLEDNPRNRNYILGLVQAYQQLEEYAKAETLLLKNMDARLPQPDYEIELGHNYDLMGNTEEAEKFYKIAEMHVMENPSYAYVVGRAFEKYSLLDHAADTYQKAMELDDRIILNSQLASVYGEQGKIDMMFDTYVDLIVKDEKYTPVAQRTFSRFITEDPSNPANVTFKNLLLKRIQQQPELIYNKLLSWLFIQQKDYKKAFLQEKAIYKRSDGDMQGIINLAGITLDENVEDITGEILGFIIDNSMDPSIQLSARQKLLSLKISNAPAEEYTKLAKEYEDLIATFGRLPQTLSLQVEYAHFLAFNMNEKERAITYLKESLQLPLSEFQEARAKMELADILVLDEKFNSALIYYSQIQKKVKNDVLAQEARYKVARTSYYKGDFEWAQTQLKVLKSSATQLIANDAQRLYLLIADNSLEDTTLTALKKFAHADLLSFQNKKEEAIQAYAEILENHKGESIEDETFMAQAKVYEELGNHEAARDDYLRIIQYYGKDILADEAHYQLANLYAGPLKDDEKAKEQYEAIIFNFEDSIYYVEAQKKYRRLRGDAIN
tara:strand:- start:37170 stop:38981 length:1812 start_codon:yes stop_codon:yes gene_type:complete